MNKMMRGTSLLAILCLTAAPRLEAQMGPLIDWIHRLSGPQFSTGVGFHASSTLFGISSDQDPAVPGSNGLERRSSTQLPTNVSLTHGLRVRVNFVFPRTAQVRSGGSVTMEKLEIKLEFPWALSKLSGWDLGPVFSYAHYWFFEGVDPFQHSSFSAGVQLRPAVGRFLHVRLAVFVHVFPPFETTDFAPLVVDVSRTSFELVPGFAIGADLNLREICRSIRLC